jgi:hypothetical protein
MNIGHTLSYQENYIRENNYIKICDIKLCCCELNFYKNRIYYLQQFICWFYKS